MLYIFYVDLARRLMLDVNLINQSVIYLKHVIEKNEGIPVSKQVLLISGGECLDDEAKVCSYTAGTDTNPIYLFNRSFVEKPEPITHYLNMDFKNSNLADAQLIELHKSFDNDMVPISIYTMNKINYLAQKYHENAADMLRFCEDLNTDQLLQHQGWSAAVANLDDVLIHFRKICASFEQVYTTHLETRQENINLLNEFVQDLKVLSRIPLLPALLHGNDEERVRVEICRGELPVENSDPDFTLVRWISAKQPGQDINLLVENCQNALDRYDDYALESFKQNVNKLYSEDRLNELRSSAEITDRLISLSRLMVTIKQQYELQAKHAMCIRSNVERAQQENDNSVLPDLVHSHRHTLRVMRNNHVNMRSCRQMCVQKKKELCDITHTKLKVLVEIQEKTAELRNNLILHNGNMSKLREYLDLLQQLHCTPRNYIQAVCEVVRRRCYSQAFLVWAEDLAGRLSSIYAQETERRRRFLEEFQGHFLNCLFPGLEDMPPTFATQAPPIFDDKLPGLCEEDLKRLRECLPEMEEVFDLPDMRAVKDFFILHKSQSGGNENGQADNLNFSISTAGQETFQTPMESSCQNISMLDVKFDEEEMTEEHKEEQDQKATHTVQTNMAVMETVAHNTVLSLRKNMSILREYVYSHQTDIVRVVRNLYFQTLKQGNQIHAMVQQLSQKEEQLKNLLAAKEDLEVELRRRLEKDENPDEKTRALVAQEVEMARREVTARLTQEHKREMDSMRARFRLVTNMERTPSDNNLEKMERGDVIEFANHKALMAQMKCDLELEAEAAVRRESERWQLKLSEELRAMSDKYEREKGSMYEECCEQLDIMKIREQSLLSDLQKHKETIHLLTEPEGNGNYSLVAKIEELEREKNQLKDELIKERTAKYSICGSSSRSPPVIVSSDSSTGSMTSNNSSSEVSMTRSVSNPERIFYMKPCSPLLQGKVCISTCNPGDAVLVVWDESQKNYTILQNSPTIHFLYHASLEMLKLNPPEDGSPKNHYCPAEVVEKEYCKVKKTPNRYNLREGECLYRVKVKPLHFL